MPQLSPNAVNPALPAPASRLLQSRNIHPLCREDLLRSNPALSLRLIDACDLLKQLLNAIHGDLLLYRDRLIEFAAAGARIPKDCMFVQLFVRQAMMASFCEGTVESRSDDPPCSNRRNPWAVATTNNPDGA